MTLEASNGRNASNAPAETTRGDDVDSIVDRLK